MSGDGPAVSPSDPLTAADLTAALALFWHPVCTLGELAAATAAGTPLAVRLLGRELAVADTGEEVIALDDRCLHRSTRLSVGAVEPDGVRCAYHGWKWDGAGRCVEIPAMPDGPIPGRARVGAYATAVHYGLVWVCIDERAGLPLPACPPWGDPTLRITLGTPYTWPVASGRRVENFVDLSHFAWVHDGSLGRREEPVHPVPDVQRSNGELRFVYDAPADFDAADSAMYGWSGYRMPMPGTVNIEFHLATGARRLLWMTASPIDDATCRSFWMMARDDDIDGDDAPYLDFQRLVLTEDQPVVCAQVPGDFPLDTVRELSVRTDKVSIEYRRWMREIALASRRGPEAVAAVVGAGASAESPPLRVASR